MNKYDKINWNEGANMLLSADICNNTIRAWQYGGYAIQIMKIIVGIIIIVTSLPLILTAINKGSSEAILTAAKSLAKKIAAGVIIFYIPSVITVGLDFLVNTKKVEDTSACELCLYSPSNEKCVALVKAFDDMLEKEAKEFEDNNKIMGDLNTCDLGLSASQPLDLSQHINDFNNSNYRDYINSLGGFKNYTKQLGGIYTNYFGKNWRGETTEDLINAAEYVFGYMSMIGFDYYNGKGERGHYCKWGGGCIYYNTIRAAEQAGTTSEITYPRAVSDAFYPGIMMYDNGGLSGPKNDFDTLIQRNNMTTNCNWSVDMIYWKAGIFKYGKRADGTPEFQASNEIQKQKKYGKVITRLCDVRVGDLIHFYDTDIDHTNMDTWDGKKWVHVAFVGEIDSENKTITVYDGGSSFITSRNYKWTFSSDVDWPKSLHGHRGIGIVRIKELK